MRIALCLSGMPRAVEEAYPFIKNAFFLDKYQVDVFAHTWLEDPWRDMKNQEYQPPIVDYDTRINEMKKILSLYKPKSFSIDEYHIKQDYYESDPNFVLAIRWCSCMESVYRANELKKKYEEQNNFKYDCVIRCRYDTGFLQSFNFEDYDLENHVYTQDVGKDPVHHLNDAIVFSSSKRMDTWSELYLHMKETAIEMLKDYPDRTEFYKRTRRGIETHDLYSYWANKNKLNARMVPIHTVTRAVTGKFEFH